jgi:hypothetical protein
MAVRSGNPRAGRDLDLEDRGTAVGVLGIDEKADRQLADVYVFGCHRASIAEETSRIGMLQ